ncbi:MAG: AbrB/MazE/SpoVT family DNA-binding domain-containing protein [Oculatellaceae cyanobacterium Prado106]|nr:AbrB/MazE/SpoVT family DNA-binding domain-containing protein [Oculatellaceae cyanobacterium Prado106]
MANVVGQWGASLGVRIPQCFADEIGLKVGSEVNLEVIDNKIVISRVQKKYQLEELLADVTPERINGEYDWGEPIDKEAE